MWKGREQKERERECVNLLSFIDLLYDVPIVVFFFFSFQVFHLPTYNWNPV